MCRQLLERCVEAIFDAGMRPEQLRGTKTGVFIGACFSETEKTWFYDKLESPTFGVTGYENVCKMGPFFFIVFISKMHAFDAGPTS